MASEIWVGIIGTVVLLGFIINGMRLSRGPEGHAANAGRLHTAVGVLALPFMWMAVIAATNM
jgi:hypothetical protein